MAVISTCSLCRRHRRIRGPSDRDQRAAIVEDVNVDDADAFAEPTNSADRIQRRIDGWPDIVDPEVDRRQRALENHGGRIVADSVDHGRYRTAMPLTAARSAFELRSHRRADRDLLLFRVEVRDLHSEEGDEGRIVEQLLNIGFRQAHGVTTILPKTWRSSMARNASRAPSSGKVFWMTTFNAPPWTSCSSASM